jgi:GNAT superfamily N-acetyltransferase
LDSFCPEGRTAGEISVDIKVSLEEREIDRATLESLLSTYEYGRYCEDKSLPLDPARQLVLDRLLQYLAQPDSRRIAAYSPAGELLGLITFKISDWDSEHFGVTTAIIETIVTRKLDYEKELYLANTLVRKFLDWSKTSEVRFVSVKVPSKDLPVVHGLESNGFHFIESWIFNKFDLSRLEDLSEPSHKLRLARPEDRDFMVEYSHDAFSTHRFHADAHIPRKRADSLYEKWILTAFDDPHQEILVLDSDQRPAAFMIYYLSDLRPYFGQQYVMWKMGLLDPQSRSKGLGRLFFTSLLYHHRAGGFDVVDSGLSIRNIASLNLHTRLNFKITCSLVTFHRWLDD